MKKNPPTTEHASTRLGKMLLIVAIFFIAPVAMVFAQENAPQTGEAPESAKQTSAPLAAASNFSSSFNSSDLLYHIPSEQLSVLSININTEIIDVPIIRYSARQAIVKGVMIIVGDIHAQGHIDQTLNALAKSLPDWGWHTILISPSQEYLRRDGTAASDANSQDNKTTNEPIDDSQQSANAIEPSANQSISFPQVDITANTLQSPELNYTNSEYQTFLAALSQALSTRFAQQAGFKAIYAKGKSAAGFAHLLSSSTTNNIDALIVENIYWPTSQHNALIPEHISSINIPVLDLVSMSDNHWALKTTSARAVAAKVNLRPLYRQSELIGADLGMRQHAYLAQETIAWTYFLGW